MVGAKKTCGMFFVSRMHADGLGTIIKTETALSVSAAMRGIMIGMASTLTSPPDIILRLEAGTREESNHSLTI
jgi:hypothetical protein